LGVMVDIRLSIRQDVIWNGWNTSSHSSGVSWAPIQKNVPINAHIAWRNSGFTLSSPMHSSSVAGREIFVSHNPVG
jgi:hypothetical protein